MRLSHDFVIPYYKLIFEHDPPYMSQGEMVALINIANWYSSLSGTFVRIVGGEKSPHVLPRLSTNNLVMQEVSYYISIGLSTGLHMKKKAPWPFIPLWIGLYEIMGLKDADVEGKDLEKFEFGTKDYNMYNPHYIFMNHCVKVYYPFINGAFDWAEEDRWRYS